jgi:hypothetical protein
MILRWKFIAISYQGNPKFIGKKRIIDIEARCSRSYLYAQEENGGKRNSKILSLHESNELKKKNQNQLFEVPEIKQKLEIFRVH